jgi:CubicO group peptidase (beta-lactamase class C family)
VTGLRESLSAAFAARPDPAAVPAASVALHAGDELRVAWGADSGTLFQAASISKPVAALAALRLAADGRLSLDRDVNAYLTSWRLPGLDRLPPVTVRQLLCHSGALTVRSFPGYQAGQPLPTLTEILDGHPPANTPPVRRDGMPGRAHRYSGGGLMVLQQILEDVTGQPFAEIVAELVFGPALMTTATYAQPAPERAAAAFVSGARVSWYRYPELAAAGLWCTPSDLVRFARAIQFAVAGAPGALLPRDLAQAMVSPQVPGWGLGIRLWGDGPHRRFSHGGNNYGYNCALIASVSDSYAAAVMTGSDAGVPVIISLLTAIHEAIGWPDHPVGDGDPIW